jgi:uncharacterized repeat protein (TIGR01451 family)
MRIVTSLIVCTCFAVALFATPSAEAGSQQADRLQYDKLKAQGLLAAPRQVPAPSSSSGWRSHSPVEGPTAGLLVPRDTTFRVVPFLGGAPPLYRNDDSFSDSIPLSFTFRFFGMQTRNIFVNNNGNISLGTGYGAFTSTGFPIDDYRMIAAFWADVDTRGARSGVVYYKSWPNRFVVIWDSVGYFNSMADKRNTFEIIITDGTDPLIGLGNNVAICYGDMQWTTGSASGGIGGFGGTPATVGANRGDSTNYALIGRFDHEGTDYDGPGGRADGVSYLDGRQFFFNIAQGLGTIAGVVYREDNGNCVREANEPGLGGWSVRLEPGGIWTTSDSSGRYFFSFLQPNTYTVTQFVRPNWQQLCPAVAAGYTVRLDSGQTRSGLDFGNRATASVQDLAVAVSGGIARPGFQKYFGIRWENLGTVAVTNAVVTFTLPVQTTHLEASPGGTHAAGVITWNLGTVAAGATGWLWERVQIPASVPRGAVLTSSAVINPRTGDVTVANNTDWESQIVQGSFDPNDKVVSPAGAVDRTDTLRYTIRFQNVGNDTAFNIRITDSIDASLDIGTLTPGGSSHRYSYLIVPPRDVVFRFDNINLVDSVHNEPLSHGFVTFTIRPRSDATAGASIANRAAVFFDFNTPVITNTVLNTISAAAIVYPGDATNDGRVDARDILPVGRHFGLTGSARQGGSTTWSAQTVPTAWAVPEACYADCNGDGQVAANDVEGLITNWGRTRNGNEAPPTNPLAVCEALLREIDALGPPQGGMLEIRRAVVRYMTRELGVAFDFSLDQNWPNPFNPSTTIGFTLPGEGSQVTLAIYDVLGRLVWESRLVNTMPGHQSVVWDGTTLSGVPAGSGIYLYRLTAGANTAVRRMLLVK